MSRAALLLLLSGCVGTALADPSDDRTGAGGGGAAGAVMPDGTLAEPGLAFALDPNTGVHRLGEDVWCLVAGTKCVLALGLDAGFPFLEAYDDAGLPVYSLQQGTAGVVRVYTDRTAAANGGVVASTFATVKAANSDGGIRLDGANRYLRMTSDIAFGWSNSATLLSTMDTQMSRQAAGIIRLSDSDDTEPTTIRFMDPGARPACDSTLRGTYWHENSAGGVIDTVSVCAKNASNAYAWRDLYPLHGDLGGNSLSDSANTGVSIASGEALFFATGSQYIGWAAGLGTRLATANVDGQLRITDSTAGNAGWLTATRQAVEVKTGAYSIDQLDSRDLFTNTGATARVDLTLPSAIAGLCNEFAVQDADGLKIIAAAGDTIRNEGTVSGAGGYICDAATIGNTLKLCALNTTEWFVQYAKGTWTIDSGC